MGCGKTKPAVAVPQPTKKASSSPSESGKEASPAQQTTAPEPAPRPDPTALREEAPALQQVAPTPASTSAAGGGPKAKDPNRFKSSPPAEMRAEVREPPAEIQPGEAPEPPLLETEVKPSKIQHLADRLAERIDTPNSSEAGNLTPRRQAVVDARQQQAATMPRKEEPACLDSDLLEDVEDTHVVLEELDRDLMFESGGRR